MAELQFVVRPMQESDLNEWFRLRKLLWDATGDDDHQSEMWDIIEHTDSQLVLVADIGSGRLAGFLEVSIRPFVEDCETDHVGYLEGWFVDHDYRRNGIGTQLVSVAEIWAKQKGCTEMASDAEIGNDMSLAAHTSLGYAETSRLVHLRKELD
ncbi:MAG: GNAT family N-acetyltransferase [Acidobacteriota bacterium]|nr:GNAT family N-acetyltransferase [Acidobacteriota bacterium]